jgi:hypothetical protein
MWMYSLDISNKIIYDRCRHRLIVPRHRPAPHAQGCARMSIIQARRDVAQAGRHLDAPEAAVADPKLRAQPRRRPVVAQPHRLCTRDQVLRRLHMSATGAPHRGATSCSTTLQLQQQRHCQRDHVSTPGNLRRPLCSSNSSHSTLRLAAAHHTQVLDWATCSFPTLHPAPAPTCRRLSTTLSPTNASWPSLLNPTMPPPAAGCPRRSAPRTRAARSPPPAPPGTAAAAQTPPSPWPGTRAPCSAAGEALVASASASSGNIRSTGMPWRSRNLKHLRLTHATAWLRCPTQRCSPASLRSRRCGQADTCLGAAYPPGCTARPRAPAASRWPPRWAGPRSRRGKPWRWCWDRCSPQTTCQHFGALLCDSRCAATAAAGGGEVGCTRSCGLITFERPSRNVSFMTSHAYRQAAAHPETCSATASRSRRSPTAAVLPPDVSICSSRSGSCGRLHMPLDCVCFLTLFGCVPQHVHSRSAASQQPVTPFKNRGGRPQQPGALSPGTGLSCRHASNTRARRRRDKPQPSRGPHCVKAASDSD